MVSTVMLAVPQGPGTRGAGLVMVVAADPLTYLPHMVSGDTGRLACRGRTLVGWVWLNKRTEKHGIDQLQEIVRIAERPDLVPMVAQWLWDEWHLDAGDSLKQSVMPWLRLCPLLGRHRPSYCWLITDRSEPPV